MYQATIEPDGNYVLKEGKLGNINLQEADGLSANQSK